MKNREDEISFFVLLRIIVLELYLLVRNRFGHKYILQLEMNGPHSEQLQLIYVVRANITTNGKLSYGGYFHSLVWIAQHKYRWVKRAVITKKQFQGNNSTERWVHEIHSFDSKSGTAVLKVAENDKPLGAKTIIYCNYSLRNWDLNKNVELEVLQSFKNPLKS
ncbi:MAG: hypothetical protein AB2786_06075 [Candidatus Thiodiazotropha endolucinida]